MIVKTSLGPTACSFEWKTGVFNRRDRECIHQRPWLVSESRGPFGYPWILQAIKNFFDQENLYGNGRSRRLP